MNHETKGGLMRHNLKLFNVCCPRSYIFEQTAAFRSIFKYVRFLLPLFFKGNEFLMNHDTKGAHES